MSLFSLAQAGDPEALSSLVRQHIPLVQALCRRFPWSEDVFQQGCMGLLQAIRSYKEERGIAAHAGTTPEELALLLEQSKGPVYDETGMLFSSLPDPLGENWLLRFCILDALSRLPKEESWLIRQRYVAGRTQAELAQALSVSQSSISRQEKQAREHFTRAWCEV